MKAGGEDTVGSRTHVVMRDVNRRIRELGELTATERIAFFCECVDPLCGETMTLTVHEYDAARAHSSLVLLRPGHRAAGVEHVVEANERFSIVETLGSTARLLRETPY